MFFQPGEYGTPGGAFEVAVTVVYICNYTRIVIISGTVQNVTYNFKTKFVNIPWGMRWRVGCVSMAGQVV